MRRVNEATADYGPLRALIGTWRGDRGVDISPEPDGSDENAYSETIRFTAAGDVDNAATQELAIVRYHQIVTRKRDGEVFHDQVGFWTWEPAAGIVAQSIAIPRGVALLAGGRFAGAGPDGEIVLEVSARRGDDDWGIVEAPFMRDHASTLAFHHRLVVRGDRLEYDETTTLAIYGREFAHQDRNRLLRSTDRG